MLRFLCRVLGRVYVYFVFLHNQIVIQYWLIGWSNTCNQCECECVELVAVILVTSVSVWNASFLSLLCLYSVFTHFWHLSVSQSSVSSLPARSMLITIVCY